MSANGWRRPWNPVCIGPGRSWMCPANLRSHQSMMMTLTPSTTMRPSTPSSWKRKMRARHRSISAITLSTPPKIAKKLLMFAPGRIHGSVGHVHERGRVHAEPVRLGRAVGHDVEAELAARRLVARVHLARGRLEHLRHLGAHLAGGHALDALDGHLPGLAHLVEPAEVARHGVAARVGLRLPLEPVVDAVRRVLAQVVRQAGRAQHRTRRAPGERLLLRHHAEARLPRDEDLVAVHEALELVHAAT